MHIPRVSPARSILLLTAAVVTFGVLAIPASAFADSTVVVTPANMQGWGFLNDQTEGPGTGMMVLGPATPPLGIGSAQLTATSTTDGQILYFAGSTYADVPLANLTTLSYATYQSPSNTSTATAISLQFDVVQDVTATDPSYQGRIVYEPYNNGGTVPLGTWTTWNALNGGNGEWWLSDSSKDFAGNCPQSAPCTLSHIESLYPNIGVSPDGAVVLKAGSGWAAFSGNADDLTIGVLGTNTTYDFDPNPSTVTVTIDKFIDGSKATAGSADSDAFPMVSSWDATNLGSGNGSYTLSPTGFNSLNAYEAITSPMTSGASYATNEVTGGSVVGADCTTDDPYMLAGYTTGSTEAAAAEATPTATPPSLTNLTSNEYVIVWNDTCTPAAVVTDPATNVLPTSATVNGTDGAVSADNTSFWWGTTPISGTLVSGANPGGTSEFPSSDWSHDGGLGSALAGGSLSEPLTGLTPNTEYYFVAWSEIGGIWYPGAVLNFTTPAGPLPTVVTDPATAITSTGATVNGTDGAVSADNTSFWWGTTALTQTLTPGANPAATSEFPSSTWSHDSGLGGASAGGNFSETLTSLAPGTQYYFVAWVESNGIWYPGEVLSFIMPIAAVSCPANTSPTFIETDNVDSSSVTPILTSPLTSGQIYLLTSSGTWQNSDLNVADTAYSSLNNWTDYMEGYDIAPYFLGPNEFNLMINGGFVNWGPYSNSHQYSLLYTGTGAPVSLGVFDGDSNQGPSGLTPGWYGDNSGSLSVNVYACQPTTGSLTVEKATVGGNNTFTFMGSNGVGSFTLTTTGTSAGGNAYQTFPNLIPGDYTITEGSQPKGWTQTDSDCSNVSVIAGGAATCTITDTNNKLLGVIRGTKYEDMDGDGSLKDGDHHTLPGVTIDIIGSNGYSASAVTDSHGNYQFVGLAAGTYTVSESVPPGWVETVPASGSYTVHLSAGQVVRHDDFGDFKLGSISGFEFNDVNDNGHKDPGESGSSGWTINLSGPRGFSATTVTGSNGSYSFTGLKAGTYTLSEVSQSGWTETAHPPHIIVFSGTNSQNDNFGNTQHPKNPGDFFGNGNQGNGFWFGPDNHGFF